jgi:hypothetical protein
MGRTERYLERVALSYSADVLRAGAGKIGRFALAAVAAGIVLAVAVPSRASESVQPINSTLCADMKATHVLNPGAPVGCERLSLVTFDYVDFDGVQHEDGQVVVMDAVATRVLTIFQTLHKRGFPVARAKLMDAYSGDDEKSMADDNTSAFNDRDVPTTTRKSLHAYGVAIDINPVQNPFIERGAELGAVFVVHPTEGAGYLNRMISRPGKPERRGFAEEVAGIFAENGFTVWGGNWDDPIDYQHFDVGRPLTEALAKLPPEQARKTFEDSVAHR